MGRSLRNETRHIEPSPLGSSLRNSSSEGGDTAFGVSGRQSRRWACPAWMVAVRVQVGAAEMAGFPLRSYLVNGGQPVCVVV